MKIVEFQTWECNVEITSYQNNDRIAIILSDIADGNIIAVGTVNLPDEELASDEVFIKDYSENEGMLDSLMKADIIHAPHRLVVSGFALIPVCKLKDID